MQTPSFAWSIRLSLGLYRWLLRLGPPEYRLEYAEPTLQLFRACCNDAYTRSGTWGVLALWPAMFSDAISGMLAEQISPERIRRMVPTIRWSLIMTLAAFILFGIAYVFLLHIIDPLPPFEAAAHLHPELGIAYTAIRGCADIACCAVVLGGLPILYSILRHALTEKRGILTLFAIPLKRIGLLLGLAILLEVAFLLFLVALQFLSSGKLPQNMTMVVEPGPLAQLGVLTLATFLLLLGGTMVAQIILRGELHVRMLRYVYLLMGVTTVAMSVTMAATLFWLVRLWIDAPLLADSQGLGIAGLRGDIGGSEGVVVVACMMLVAAVVVAISLRRCLGRARIVPVTN